MALVGRGAERLAGGAAQDLARRVARTVGMHVGAQPRQKRCKAALGDGRQNIRIGGLRGGEELRRRESAERVRREVAEVAAIPVDVLEAAHAVVVGDDAERCLHGLAPGAR